MLPLSFTHYLLFFWSFSSLFFSLHSLVARLGASTLMSSWLSSWQQDLMLYGTRRKVERARWVLPPVPRCLPYCQLICQYVGRSVTLSPTVSISHRFQFHSLYAHLMCGHIAYASRHALNLRDVETCTNFDSFPSPLPVVCV